MQTFVGCSMFRDLDTLLYMVFCAQAFEFTIWFQPTTFLSFSLFLSISFLLSLTPKIHSEHAYVCGVVWCMLFLHICVVFPFHFLSVDSSKTQISRRKQKHLSTVCVYAKSGHQTHPSRNNQNILYDIR